MTATVISAALVGALVGALLPRLIALIPDREPIADAHGGTGTVAAPGPGAHAESEPGVSEGPEPSARAMSGPDVAAGPEPGVPAKDVVTPYRTLAAVPHLAWYLAVPTAALWALLAASGWDASLPAVLLVAGLGVAMGYIDVREHRLPDWLTYPAFGAAAGALAVAALVTGEWSEYGRAWAAAAALAGALLVLALIRPGELGFGDVKLATSLGLLLGWIGWGHVILGAFLGFALGGIYSAVLLVLRRAGRRTAIPFGPFLLAGTFTAIAWGDTLLDAYLG